MSATLNFPKVLKICVVDSATQQPVSRITFMLTLFAPHKNNYHLAKVSNGDGIVCVSASEMRESIRTDQELFPMDYASSAEECDAEIDVKVCTIEEVKRAVQAMEMFKSVSKIDERLIQELKGSNNANYHPTTQRIKLDVAKDEVLVKIQVRSVLADA